MAFIDIFKGWKFKTDETITPIAAPYVTPQNDDASYVIGANYFGQYQYNLNMQQQFIDDVDMIIKYRDVALNPEVDSAITDIVNEAICMEDESAPVDIVMDDLTELPDNIKDIIQEEFQTCLRLLDANSKLQRLFRKWYVDGRLVFLKVIDNKNPQMGIQELRYIPATNVKKIREEIVQKLPGGETVTSEFREYYLYTKEMINAKNASTGIKLTGDSVAFVTSGLIEEKTNTVYSYLHKSIKPANQLRMIEDAIMIYTLARAPARRVFYVDTGNLFGAKADEYLRKVQSKFKTKMIYDSVSGQLKDASNTISMMEDIYLPRTAGGRATEVSMLEGGTIGGSVDLMDYYKKRLYQTLNVPLSRITGETGVGFTIGRPSEISREEIKFGKFIQSLRKEFAQLLYDVLRTQLLLKQIITAEDWEIIREKITFNFISDNHFEELKNADILRERIATLKELDPMTPIVGTYYSREFIRKHVLYQSDEDIKLINQQIAQEISEMDQAAPWGDEDDTPTQNPQNTKKPK